MDKKTKKKAFWCGLGTMLLITAGVLGYRNRDKITDVFNKKHDN